MDSSLIKDIARGRLQNAGVRDVVELLVGEILLPVNWMQRFVGLVFLGLALVNLYSPSGQSATTGTDVVWLERPVLGYFALTSSLSDPLRNEVGLSTFQLELIQRVARLEVQQLEDLRQKSLVYISNTELSLAQKRSAIMEMDYNQRVYAISRTSQQFLALVLGSKTYTRFSRWMEERWEIERVLHGAPRLAGSARTYEIYATRYDSKGAYYVALPDQCVKFTNGGNHLCEKDGYVVGQRYDVFVNYKKGVAARVGESGPWNVDDTYWATYGDPTPRRMFADLALGMPEAQAAYFNGYNGGADQYGRKVTAPYGIDLARQVSIDIGLEPGNNDWIKVGFLWTEGWGQAGTGASQASSQTTAMTPTQPPASSARAATPQGDGSIVHVVQAGQTLWEIAAIYNISLQELLDLNKLSQDSMIREGQKLIVKGADPGLPLTQTANAIVPTDTPRPTRTPTPTSISPQPSATEIAHVDVIATTEIESGPTNHERDQETGGLKFISAINPWLLVIGGIVVGGLLLMLVGMALDRMGH